MALFAFWIRYTIIAAKISTAIRPPTQPAPRAPVVINVPIWYTRKPTVNPVANWRQIPANSHLPLCISEFMAPSAAKQGGV